MGRGLALRFAAAGRRVVLGSRRSERAEEAAREVIRRLPDAEIVGTSNGEAITQASIVVVTLPFEHTCALLRELKDRFSAAQIVVSTGVPLASAVGDAPVRTLGVWQGSCAELVASCLPAGVSVVSAFQNVSAERLQLIDVPVDCDVVVSGPREARRCVMALCQQIPGLRGIDGGSLENARVVEALTVLLIGMNRRYKVERGIGVRFTSLPGDADS